MQTGHLRTLSNPRRTDETRSPNAGDRSSHAEGAGEHGQPALYYEREGRIRPAAKSAAGYRLYTEEGIRRIAFIKQAQQCGFSLREIRALFELRATDDACCDDIYRVAVEKKLRLERKIRALAAMSQALTRWIEMCSRDRRSLDACPIPGALEAGLAVDGRAAPKVLQAPAKSA